MFICYELEISRVISNEFFIIIRKVLAVDDYIRKNLFSVEFGWV